jgi:hypothetical protein
MLNKKISPKIPQGWKDHRPCSKCGELVKDGQVYKKCGKK